MVEMEFSGRKQLLSFWVKVDALIRAHKQLKTSLVLISPVDTECGLRPRNQLSKTFDWLEIYAIYIVRKLHISAHRIKEKLV